MTKNILRSASIIFATILATAAIALIACAPAAESQPSGPTRAEISPPNHDIQTDADPAARTSNLFHFSTNPPEHQSQSSDTNPGPPPTSFPENPIIQTQLQEDIEDYKAEKQKRQTRGEAMESSLVYIVIFSKTPAHVDRHLEFMREHAVGHINWYKGDGTVPRAAGVSGRISIELIEQAAQMEGVLLIDRVRPSQPAGSSYQTGPTPTIQPIQVHGADTWRTAGFTGTGIDVGIIDFDFREFSTKVANPSGNQVEFLCFDRNGNSTHTNFATCERTSPTPAPNPHGTDVAAALKEIAPDVKYYISNATFPDQREAAVTWMTNTNNVKVINHSQVALWDGPGDGTSPFHTGVNVSPLYSVETAIANEAMWVNAAGNHNKSTWFSRSLSFNANNYLTFGTSPNVGECNQVSLDARKDYTFQLRWKDSWPRSDIDLNLHLFGPTGLTTPGSFVQSSTDSQNGNPDHYPRELIDYSPSTNGTYCLYVSKDSSETAPEWTQLQVFTGGAQLAHSTNAGSISNPAESNSPAALSVGAANNDATPALKDFSSRGPAPEPFPPERIKPEAVAVNTTRSGTSFSAPRISGLAALAVQALGHLEDYNEPHEIAQFIQEHAIQQSPPDPNNDWGHGLARLPQPDIPTNVVLSHNPCHPDLKLKAQFESNWPVTPATGNNVRYGFITTDTAHGIRVSLRGLRNNPQTLEGFEGHTYHAAAFICVGRAPNDTCTAPSSPSTTVTIPEALCTPQGVSTVPSDGIITVRWTAEPHADTYDVEDADGNIATTEFDNIVFEELDNDSYYRFRVRANGSLGTTNWSPWWREQPSPATPVVPPRFGARPATYHPTQGARIRASWDWYVSPTEQNATHQLRMWDPIVQKWKQLPFKQKGESTPYEIHYRNSPSRTEAMVTRLKPGTTYYFMIRGINGTLHSEWSDQFSTTTLGNPPPGSTPAPPPPVKAPPKDLVATVNSSSVDLTWTPGTNPNYTDQNVKRRIAGERPINWTKFPVGVDVNNYTDSSGVSGTTYIYRVEALKANGKGGMTNPQEVTFP